MWGASRSVTLLFSAWVWWVQKACLLGSTVCHRLECQRLNCFSFSSVLTCISPCLGQGKEWAGDGSEMPLYSLILPQLITYCMSCIMKSWVAFISHTDVCFWAQQAPTVRRGVVVFFVRCVCLLCMLPAIRREGDRTAVGKKMSEGLQSVTWPLIKLERVVFTFLHVQTRISRNETNWFKPLRNMRRILYMFFVPHHPTPEVFLQASRRYVKFWQRRTYTCVCRT